jgi:hypothetical protein
MGQTDKLVHMRFESLQGDVWFRFSLDFGAERLHFEPLSDFGAYDTGTAESAERIHEVTRFFQDCFGNGQLHIVNADTGDLIGRKDAYIPLNMMPLTPSAPPQTLRIGRQWRSGGAIAIALMPKQWHA